MTRLFFVAGGLVCLLACSHTAVTVVEVRRDVPRNREGVVHARVSVSAALVQAAYDDGGRISFRVEPELRYPWLFRSALDWGISVAPRDEAPTATGIAEGTAFRTWETFDDIPLDGLQEACFATCLPREPSDTAATDTDTDTDTDTTEPSPQVVCDACALPVEIRLTREDAAGWLRARLDLIAVVHAPGSAIGDDDDQLRIDLIDVGLD